MLHESLAAVMSFVFSKLVVDEISKKHCWQPLVNIWIPAVCDVILDWQIKRGTRISQARNLSQGVL